MTSFSQKNISFAFQEGPEYEKDLLDYTLVLLYAHCRETIPSPAFLIPSVSTGTQLHSQTIPPLSPSITSSNQ